MSTIKPYNPHIFLKIQIFCFRLYDVSFRFPLVLQCKPKQTFILRFFFVYTLITDNFFHTLSGQLYVFFLSWNECLFPHNWSQHLSLLLVLSHHPLGEFWEGPHHCLYSHHSVAYPWIFSWVGFFLLSPWLGCLFELLLLRDIFPYIPKRNWPTNEYLKDPEQGVGI